jgi:hypothetical protein
MQRATGPFKERLVGEGRAHAALVFDGDDVVAWAQYVTVEELPNIHHRGEWEQTVEERPDLQRHAIHREPTEGSIDEKCWPRRRSARFAATPSSRPVQQ